MLFDLYLLVTDINIAAQMLGRSGWTLIPQQNGRIGNASLDLSKHPQCRLAPPAQDDATGQDPSAQTPTQSPYRSSTIVLLPVADWSFNFDTGISSRSFIPTLEALLDGLIGSQLDSLDEMELQDYLRVQIGYLYRYAPELQKRSFAHRLLYEHRQYHFDVCSGMSFSTLAFVAHQHSIREALRRRGCELQECSASRNNEDLFNQDFQSRLLASLPPPQQQNSVSTLGLD